MTISQQIAKQRARRKQNEAARRKKFENAKLIAKKATRAKALNSRANSKILQNLNTLQELEQKLVSLDLSIANENIVASKKHGVGVESESCIANKNCVSSENCIANENRVASENSLDLSVANKNCIASENCVASKNHTTNKKHNLPLANKSHSENQGKIQSKIKQTKFKAKFTRLIYPPLMKTTKPLQTKLVFTPCIAL